MQGQYFHWTKTHKYSFITCNLVT